MSGSQPESDNLNPELVDCDFCGISTDVLYEYSQGNDTKKLCLLCIEQETNLVPSDSVVGYFGVKNDTRRCFLLLKRALLRAECSQDEEAIKKASLIFNKLSESCELVNNTFGSVVREDLKLQLSEQENLVLIDSDNQVKEKISKHTTDKLPDVHDWADLYQNYKEKHHDNND